jgi:DNA ligase 1
MKLYKKDSKGGIRGLEIYGEGDEIVQISGRIDGKQVENRSKCVAKNLGKSNETSPEQQALLEAESRITKKLDQGYFLTLDEVESEVVMLPMLAKDYKKESRKIDWGNCFVQPKLDGMRCLVFIKKGKVTFMSRSGKEITTLDHIKEDLRGLNDMVLDGEMYAHGESFQTNMKKIKKYRKGETEEVKFHVYDKIDTLGFINRYEELVNLFKEHKFKHIELTPTYVLKDGDKSLKTYHEGFMSEGYEGSIIRWGDEGYKLNGRSSNLLKYKDFIDEVYKVVDIIPSEKRPDHGVVSVQLNKKKYYNVSPSGTTSNLSDVPFDGYDVYDYPTFECGMKFSHEEREEILRNKDTYIGMMGEVRFPEVSEFGIPRFPVCYGFRLDK